MMAFTSWQYFRAMAPIDLVIDAFINEERLRLSVADDNVWSVEAQKRFVNIVAASSQSNPLSGINSEVVRVDWGGMQILPSKRYVYKLIKRYTTRLEEENCELEDDNLASLIYYLSRSKVSNVPDPTHSSIVAYQVPLIDTCQSNTSMNRINNDDQLRIRIYPNHNDVGVCKVWEAGAALAEYIISNPEIIRGRAVVELGAGVGMTGLVAAAFGTKSVHMTDYTTSTLENLTYNITINEEWLRRRGVDPAIVSKGRLEWREYATNDTDSQTNTVLTNAEVIIAADVVYAVECIPDLVSAVGKFLSSDKGLINKLAVFATTRRNRTTFSLFESELKKRQILCDYKSHDSLPNVFPCYFNQPRTDVKVCTMTLNSVS